MKFYGLDWWVTLALLVVIVWKDLLHAVERRYWAKERKDMLNRVQANTIDSYAAQRERLEKPTLEVPKQVFTPGAEDAEVIPRVEMPAPDLAACQAAERVLRR